MDKEYLEHEDNIISAKEVINAEIDVADRLMQEIVESVHYLRPDEDPEKGLFPKRALTGRYHPQNISRMVLGSTHAAYLHQRARKCANKSIHERGIYPSRLVEINLDLLKGEIWDVSGDYKLA